MNSTTAQEQSVITNLRKNKRKYLFQAYTLIFYGFLCLGYGTVSIYHVLRDDYKLF